MRDDEYLGEEAGRRATANRLLDLIGRPRPRRPPARRRLRPRPAARRGARARIRHRRARAVARRRRAYARETLGLDVRELPLEAFSRDATATRRAVRRDRARRRARAPRRPGRRDRPLRRGCCAPAACCASSRPTRRSLTAQARRRALVGLSAGPHRPAAAPHAARADLRARAGDLGRRPVRAHVRGPALGRRAGASGSARSAARSTRRRERMPAGADQPLARRRARDARPPDAGPPPARARCCARRGGHAQVHVVLPAYNAVRTIPDVVAEMPPARRRPRAADRRRHAPDETAAVALEHGLDVLRHPANRGYGGEPEDRLRRGRCATAPTSS